MGQAAQTNVVVFYLATRVRPINRVRKNLCFLDMSNNSDTTNGSIRGPKAIGVAEGLLAPLKVLQLRHLPTTGVGEQGTCLSLGP